MHTLHSGALACSLLHGVVLCCTALHSGALACSMLHGVVPCCTALCASYIVADTSVHAHTRVCSPPRRARDAIYSESRHDVARGAAADPTRVDGPAEVVPGVAPIFINVISYISFWPRRREGAISSTMRAPRRAGTGSYNSRWRTRASAKRWRRRRTCACSTSSGPTARSPRRHHPCHICTGTGCTLPRLHQD